MAIDCGSQIVLCDLPVRFDTYTGCSHACKYCFVKRKTNIKEIKKDNCLESLKNFIKGERTQLTNWCDWDIPLHWGGVSDPFQPCERKHRISYEALKIFSETNYPNKRKSYCRRRIFTASKEMQCGCTNIHALR